MAASIRGALQLAQISILARLLRPEDYGLMAMAGVVLGFAALFSDLGLNSAYLQRRDVTEEQRSSLFWLNLGASIVLAAIIIVASPAFADFFRDDRMSSVLMLTSTTFVINALGAQVRMTAEKTLNFRPIVLIEISAAIIGFAAAVLAAIFGLGVYSLVLGAIVSAVLGTSLDWVILAGEWRPLRRFRVDDIRPFAGFGGALVGNNVVSQLNTSVDLLLGGRLLGAEQLGLYSVPRSFVLQLQFMVNPIITRVGFPLIAQIQDDRARVASVYLRTVNMTSATNAPFYVCIALFAPDLVSVLFGDGWLASVPALRLLAIWGVFRSLGNPIGSLLLGTGRADLSLKWNIGILFVMPPILYAGATYGLNGLALALVLFAAAVFVPSWIVLVRPVCPVRLSEYAICAFRPLVLSVVCCAPAYLLVAKADLVPWLRLAIGAAAFLICYIVLSMRLNRNWADAVFELLGIRNASRD